jgi:hypothetical protein
MALGLGLGLGLGLELRLESGLELGLDLPSRHNVLASHYGIGFELDISPPIKELFSFALSYLLSLVSSCLVLDLVSSHRSCTHPILRLI